jgi:hypothetical protein
VPEFTDLHHPYPPCRCDAAAAFAQWTAGTRKIFQSVGPSPDASLTILGCDPGPGTFHLISTSAAQQPHASQSEALPALLRRLDLLGSGETLRWLLFPQRIPAQHEDQVLVTAQAPGASAP